MDAALVAVRCGPEYSGPGGDKIRALPLDPEPRGSEWSWADVWIYDGYPLGSASNWETGDTIPLGGIVLGFAVQRSDKENGGDVFKFLHDLTEMAGLSVASIGWAP